jgi:hypothetical protein
MLQFLHPWRDALDDGSLGRPMSADLNALPERVEVIARTLDDLSASVDARFEQVDPRLAQIDRRFDEVLAAIVEQREYTEFAFQRVERRMDGFERSTVAGFARLERKLDLILDGQQRPVRRPQPRRPRKNR